MSLPVDASKIAEYLLKIKAVRLSIQNPFTWSAGWKSPIYCDNRLILSFPDTRKAIRDAFVASVKSQYPEAEAIAGVATGGIAMGALVADALDLPFIYVRPTPKSHGLKNQIEGEIKPGQKYVVIEDLISTGNSSAAAVVALQESGVKVIGTLAVFSYGFPKADVRFGETGTPFHTLSDLPTLLEEAAKLDYIRPEEMEVIYSWRQSPELWQPLEA
ncbi:MAG: orotate phosphoribosyltransferase [Bacteroidia bacterium]